MSALETFRKAVEHAEREGIVVTLSRFTARAILDEIDGTDSKVTAAPAINIGDTVEVIQSRSIWEGRRGKVINIEPLARQYPYSVEIGSALGGRKEISYWSQDQIRKV